MSHPSPVDIPASASAPAPPRSPSPSPSASPVLSPTSNSYPIFRKRFHVPSAWANHPAFQELNNYTYETHNHAETMNFVGSILKKLGYEGASVAMQHDYLCFMLEDLLTHRGVGFLSERELREDAALAEYIGAPGKPATPDLVLAWQGKWRLVDVYTGHQSLDDIKLK
jgi:hypothetical protein